MTQPMTQADLDEIKTYLTEDIQHDLPACVATWGLNDPLVMAFIAELESRGVKPRLTERKRDKWFDKNVRKPGQRKGDCFAHRRSLSKEPEQFPQYVDMIKGERWRLCWRRIGDAVVLDYWFFFE